MPRGRTASDPAFAAWFSINGNGEMTGTTWIEEGGLLEGPIFITNTHSVGTVRDAAVQWAVERKTLVQPWAMPVVAETYDGGLNDMCGHESPLRRHTCPDPEGRTLANRKLDLNEIDAIRSGSTQSAKRECQNKFTIDRASVYQGRDHKSLIDQNR